MRKIILFLIVAGLILAITGWTASKAVAQRATCRPWCVHYGAGGGGTNCGFISLEQCTWTTQGADICPTGPARRDTRQLRQLERERRRREACRCGLLRSR
jgi:hypothetical protein